jgi:hypothetical protein
MVQSEVQVTVSLSTVLVIMDSSSSPSLFFIVPRL